LLLAANRSINARRTDWHVNGSGIHTRISMWEKGKHLFAGKF